MNTNKKIIQAIWSCKFQNFGISQCLKSYQKFPFSNFVSKCAKDKSEQKGWLPLPHGSFFLTLVKVRFRGKNGFSLEIRDFSLERFWKKKQNCVQKSISKQMHFNFSKLKFHEIALRRPQYLTSNFAKSIQDKNFVRSAFHKKYGFHRIFVTSSHIEKKHNFPESCSWQFYVKERMWRVNYFSSMSNYGRKILILNIVIPPLQFQKYNFQRNFE